jgi:IMP dehydrogenase
VPYAGSLKDNLNISLAKIKATISTCGAMSIKDFQDNAKLTIVSPRTIVEGGVHDVAPKEMQPEQ